MNNCQTFESFRRQEMIVEIHKWLAIFSTVKQIAFKTIKAFSFFLPYKYIFFLFIMVLWHIVKQFKRQIEDWVIGPPASAGRIL